MKTCVKKSTHKHISTLSYQLIYVIQVIDMVYPSYSKPGMAHYIHCLAHE
jgi:hypothetical protein